MNIPSKLVAHVARLTDATSPIKKPRGKNFLYHPPYWAGRNKNEMDAHTMYMFFPRPCTESHQSFNESKDVRRGDWLAGELATGSVRYEIECARDIPCVMSAKFSDFLLSIAFNAISS